MSSGVHHRWTDKEKHSHSETQNSHTTQTQSESLWLVSSFTTDTEIQHRKWSFSIKVKSKVLTGIWLLITSFKLFWWYIFLIVEKLDNPSENCCSTFPFSVFLGRIAYMAACHSFFKNQNCHFFFTQVGGAILGAPRSWSPVHFIHRQCCRQLEHLYGLDQHETLSVESSAQKMSNCVVLKTSDSLIEKKWHLCT